MSTLVENDARHRSARPVRRDTTSCCDPQAGEPDSASSPSDARGCWGSPPSDDEVQWPRPDARAGAAGLVRVQLLDGFEVLVNGTARAAGRWNKQHAAALVKLLALSPRGRLHRERVVDALWPDVTLDVGLPRLHKAAHYARRELGDQQAVVLREQVVTLFPHARLEVDALMFEAAADTALATHPASPEACDEALQLAGELLPEDLAAWWLDEPRERLRLRVAQLLEGAHRWNDLLRLEPANERAHLELLREAVTSGDRTNALRRFAVMERALSTEFGVSPGREATELRELVAS